MKENKKLKFSFLIVAMISLSLLLAMIPTTFNFITTNSRGVMTSYMHEDKKLIEDDFYKSKAFDEALIRPLLYWTSTSVIDENDNRNYEKDYLENKKESAKKQLSYVKNIKYIAINKDTNEVYSNTDYKTIEDFKKNIKGKCDVYVSSNDYNTSYTKEIKNKTYEKANVNKELGDVLNYNLYDFDVCISINQNFENYSGYYDKVSEIKIDFDSEVFYFKIIIVSSIISLILFIVSIVIYKKMKCEVLDRNSFYLKFYKTIPLEIYIIASLFLLYSLIRVMETGYSVYYYYNVLDHLVYTFICIFGLFTIYYILRKEIKSFDKPIEILKTSLIVRVGLMRSSTGSTFSVTPFWARNSRPSRFQ